MTRNPDQSGGYAYGQSVQLTASPSSGYSFSSWSGDLSGSANPSSIIMNGNKTVTANFTTTPCTYALNPTSTNISASALAGSFRVTAGSGCGWSASPGQTWIHTSSSGSGNGVVSYTVDANAGISRVGTITVGGQAFTIYQAGPLDQYTYTINNGAITITGYTGPGGAVTIPSTINGLPVTSIGDWAFRNCGSLTSATMPSSVTSIGRSAFASCSSLTSVTIPSSVTSIGSGPFVGCVRLTAITVDALNSVYSSMAGVLFNKSQTTLIQCPGGRAGSYTTPNSVTSIGDEAFSFCTSLTGVTIPNSVTSIGSYAFESCTRLASVTIPNSVTSIGDVAFLSCTSLTTVTIPSSVTSIGGGPFAGCTSLVAITVDPLNPVYSSMAGVLFNKSQITLIQYPAGKAGSYTIPNSVTSIGYCAFGYCTSLTSVTIPNSVTSIGDAAFSSCTSLTSVTIPDSVTRPIVSVIF